MFHQQRQLTAMGCPCQFQVYAENPVQAQQWLSQAEQTLFRLEHKYSRYRHDSVTADIVRSAVGGKAISLDPETCAILDYADTAWQQSQGLFDITSGVLRQAWNFKSATLPSQQQIDDILPLVGWQKVAWQAPTLALKPGMEIDFGGVVKEYAADTIAAELRSLGCQHGLIDLGGDLAVVGPHANGQPWQVGIRNPNQPEKPIAQIEMAGGAIATSGDYERSMVVDGKHYGHILNPRTGWPVESFSSVTVVADLGVIAGSASTIAMLMGKEGEAWLSELGLPYLCVSQSGDVTGSLKPPSKRGRDSAI